MSLNSSHKYTNLLICIQKNHLHKFSQMPNYTNTNILDPSSNYSILDDCPSAGQKDKQRDYFLYLLVNQKVQGAMHPSFQLLQTLLGAFGPYWGPFGGLRPLLVALWPPIIKLMLITKIAATPSIYINIHINIYKNIYIKYIFIYNINKVYCL